MGYDVIGDVHGCEKELKDLLRVLDYRVSDSSGAYEHRTRQAIFVGIWSIEAPVNWAHCRSSSAW
jgi:hypothetical protein